MNFRILFLLFFFIQFVLIEKGWAERGSIYIYEPDSSAVVSTVSTDSTESKRITKKNVIIPDSVLSEGSSIFYLRSFTNTDSVYHPSFSAIDQHRFDRLLQFGNGYYAYRYGIGHPHRQLHFAPFTSTDFRFQENAFSGYLFTLENVKFIQTIRPYTDLQFSNSLTSDFQFNVIHSQNMFSNWNATLEYNMNRSEGSYLNSASLNHHLSFTSNFFSKNRRYRALGGLIWNKNKVGENGGIKEDSLFRQNIQRIGILINQPYSYTQYFSTHLFLNQSFVLRSIDSTSPDASFFNVGKISHAISYLLEKRTYFDSAGSLPFEHFYFDSLVTSDFLLNSNLRNTLSWSNDIFQDSLFRNPIKLYAGLHYDKIRALNNVDDTSFFQTRFFGMLKVSLPGEIGFSPYYEKVLSGYYSKGDQLLRAILDRDFFRGKSPLNAKVQAEFAKKRPDFIFSRYASNHFLWNQEVGQTKINNIQASFSHPLFELGAAFHQLKDFYYFNDQIRPEQYQSPIQVYQLNLNFSFVFFGALHWNAFQTLQHSPQNDIVALPGLYSKQSLFVDMFAIGKRLHLQTGFDLFYNSSYHPNAYSPDLASFYTQSEQMYGNNIWLDLFCSAQIKRAILFIKFAHINSLFIREPNYFMIPSYPTNDLLVKWGFIWKFFD